MTPSPDAAHHEWPSKPVPDLAATSERLALSFDSQARVRGLLTREEPDVAGGSLVIGLPGSGYW